MCRLEIQLNHLALSAGGRSGWSEIMFSVSLTDSQLSPLTYLNRFLSSHSTDCEGCSLAVSLELLGQLGARWVAVVLLFVKCQNE